MRISKNDKRTIILSPDELNEAIRDYLDKNNVQYNPDLCCWSLDEAGTECEEYASKIESSTSSDIKAKIRASLDKLCNCSPVNLSKAIEVHVAEMQQLACEPCYKECRMFVAEYCSNCNKKTMRKTEDCPECTPKIKESQTTDTQQLKAEIALKVSSIARDSSIPAVDRLDKIVALVNEQLSAV